MQGVISRKKVMYYSPAITVSLWLSFSPPSSLSLFILSFTNPDILFFSITIVLKFAWSNMNCHFNLFFNIFSGAPESQNQKKKRKPSRPCMFCGEIQSQLKRHILRRHSSEEQVIQALKLPTSEQNRVFEEIHWRVFIISNKKYLCLNNNSDLLAKFSRM